jgi:hypothetical protein
MSNGKFTAQDVAQLERDVANWATKYAVKAGLVPNAELTYREQRGTLSYVTPEFGIETLVGTFRIRVVEYTLNGSELVLEGTTPTREVVVARRKGGRNWWQLCDPGDVATFEKGKGWA